MRGRESECVCVRGRESLQKRGLVSAALVARMNGLSVNSSGERCSSNRLMETAGTADSVNYII